MAPLKEMDDDADDLDHPLLPLGNPLRVRSALSPLR